MADSESAFGGRPRHEIQFETGYYNNGYGARLQGNWAADIAAFDKIHEQILQMADMLTEGIVKQHPAKFKK